MKRKTRDYKTAASVAAAAAASLLPGPKEIGAAEIDARAREALGSRPGIEQTVTVIP